MDLIDIVHYLVFGAGTLIVIVLILNDVIKKGELAPEVVARSKFRFNSELFFSLAAMAIMLFMLSDFMKHYNKVYPILVPAYLDHWYELLWLDNLRSLPSLPDDRTTMFAILTYVHKLEQLLMNTPLFLTGFYFLYKGLRRAVLCESGVSLVRRIVSWDHIKGYEWHGSGENSKSIMLTLQRVPETKVEKYLDIKSEIKLLIDLEDKDIVDKLLETKIKDGNAASL